MKKNYVLFLMASLFFYIVDAQVTLTQSVDPNTVDAGGVACWSNGTGEYRDNAFFRAYNLNDFGVTGDFEISSVQYGQGSADDGKEITVSIYTADTDDLATATLTFVASATHTSSSSDDLSLVSVPLSTTIAAGSTIVFEVFADDSGTNVGETFFPGLNGAGENDDSYLLSAGCSINTPTTTSDIGFPDNQYVMNVIGNDVLSVEEFAISQVEISPNPTKDVINIQLHPSNSVKTLELFSMTGQLVYKGVAETQIDMTNFNAGVYLLNINAENGSATKRIVKQ